MSYRMFQELLSQQLYHLRTSDLNTYWSLLNKANATGNNVVEKAVLEKFSMTLRLL